MSDYVDVEAVRELAAQTRKEARTVSDQAPVAGANSKRQSRRGDGAGGAPCETVKHLSDAAAALDRAVQYHAERLEHFADLANWSADKYEKTERQNRDRFLRESPSAKQIRPGG